MNSYNFWEFVQYVEYLNSIWIPIVLICQKWCDIEGLFQYDKINVVSLWQINKQGKFSYDLFLDTKINIVEDSSSESEFNEIIQNLLSKYNDKISNVIFLNDSGWLKNGEGGIISFLSKEKLKCILNWNYEKAVINSWEKKVLELIYELFRKGIHKTTIASIDWLREELEWFGSWTMVIDLEKAEIKTLENRELFDLIYSKQVEGWNWKDRTIEEKDEMFKNYKILEIDGTVLWGYCLSDCEVEWQKWKLLSCLFTTKVWSWLWYILWQEVKKSGVVFSYSKQWKFFENLWFKKVEWKKSETWAFLYVFDSD